MVIDVGWQVQHFRVQTGRRQPRSHSCNSSYSCLDKVVHTPVVCNDRCSVVQRAENCDVSQLLFLRCGADRGVMPQIMEIVQVFSLLDWVMRALRTGTGPGLTPAIRAGKGWRGRRECYSQVTCHSNSVHAHWRVMEKHSWHVTVSEPPPPTPHHTTQHNTTHHTTPHHTTHHTPHTLPSPSSLPPLPQPHTHLPTYLPTHPPTRSHFGSSCHVGSNFSLLHCVRQREL